MGTDTKYGEIFRTTSDDYAINDAEGIELLGGEDEPVFVIRAQDLASVPALRSYVQHAKAAGASQEFMDAVAARADEFSKWQGSNRGLVKTPD